MKARRGFAGRFRIRLLATDFAMFGCACLAGVIWAGPIFVAGQLEEGRFVKWPDVLVNYRIRYASVRTSIDGAQAKTNIKATVEIQSQPTTNERRAATAEQTARPSPAKETGPQLCLIPLPAGATEATVHVDGNLVNAELLDAKAAQSIYETLARDTEAVGVLALSGKPALLIQNLSTKKSMEFSIDFTQPVGEQSGLATYDCPLSAIAWASGPVERLSITVDVATEAPLRALFSPSHEAQVSREGTNRATVRVKAEQISSDDDFRLVWVADDDPLGLRLVGYRAPGDDDGYFLVLGNPTGSDDEAVLEKDLLLVLDTSGSMRGEKMEQARAALEYCLDRLNAGDRFNIVTFGTAVSRFRDELADNTADNVSQAKQFVEDVVAQGRTNIAQALAATFAERPETGRPRMAIFLTDGVPTAGELVPDKILDQVAAAQKQTQTRTFVVGVGHDVNAHLLDRLAETTNASSEYIDTNEEIDAKVAALYDRLSHPVLVDVALDFGTLQTHSRFPEKLPALFRGSEVMVFGRYRGGGEHEVTLSGTLNGNQVHYRAQSKLPAESSIDGPSVASVGGQAAEFIAPLWATRKIGYLLQEIRLHGEEKELVEEVVRLSKKFGIVTEYTIFLANGQREINDEEALVQVQKQIATANMQQSGRWAFNQARNDLNLQRKVALNNDNNSYVDRRGRVVNNTNIRQIGSRVYYLREGQWCDGEKQDKRKTRVVKLFSPEYFALLRTNQDFARSQKLGWAVSVNIGDERIVVEKDGRQQDDSLAKPTAEQAPAGAPANAPANPPAQLNNLQQQQRFQQLQNDLNLQQPNLNRNDARNR